MNTDQDATSDLGLHCFPMSHKKDTKLTVKHLYLAGIFIWRYWWYKQKSPKYETVK